jgi:predicted RNase H-like HicB family nuclease
VSLGSLVQRLIRNIHSRTFGLPNTLDALGRRFNFATPSRKKHHVLTLINGILAWALGLRNAPPEASTSRALGAVAIAELSYKIETEQGEHGRWKAEIVDLPGVLAHGSSQQEAIAKAEAIAFRVIADRIEETKIAPSRVSFGCA